MAETHVKSLSKQHSENEVDADHRARGGEGGTSALAEQTPGTAAADNAPLGSDRHQEAAVDDLGFPGSVQPEVFLLAALAVGVLVLLLILTPLAS